MGIDLVEWMIRGAAGDFGFLASPPTETQGRLHPGPRLCRGPGARLPPDLRACSPMSASPMPVSKPGSPAAAKSAAITTRCWRRSSSPPPTATPPSPPCRRRSTTRASPASKPICAGCAMSSAPRPLSPAPCPPRRWKASSIARAASACCRAAPPPACRIFPAAPATGRSACRPRGRWMISSSASATACSAIPRARPGWKSPPPDRRCCSTPPPPSA